jgi:beta-lactamase regulating signal transducer with metallopeptidase domain
MNATILLDLLSRSPGAAIAMDVAIKATLVLAAAAVASLALRRSSAAARHLAWCVGLAAALAMPVMALALPGWDWRILPAGADDGHPTPTSTDHSLAPLPAEAIHSMHYLDESEFEMTDDAEAEPATRPTVPAPDGLTWRIPAPSWSWLWAVWLAGALAVLSTPMAGRIALRRLTRDAAPITDPDWTELLRDLSATLGLTRRVVLLRSPRAVMPMTWGGFRPVILLPPEADSWTINRRRAVLLHELAHVRRLDCLTQSIARTACALYWFNPLAWVAARRMRIERERACDDVVLLAGARASEYAVHLLEIARGLRAPRAAALAAMAMARPSQLEGRLMAILDPDRRRHAPGRRVAAAAVLAAILVLFPLATLRVGSRANAVTTPRQEPGAGKPAADEPTARMTVTGRVLDPSGKPVPDAAVMLVVQSKQSNRPVFTRAIRRATVHEGRCDGSGRFRVELPRTSSARDDALTISALAPGFALGWVGLDLDADAPTAEIALSPEQVIRGRLFDVQGRPARGVEIVVQSVTQSSSMRGGPFERTSHPDFYWHHHRKLSAWPGPTISDDEGRFTLSGLGRGLQIAIRADDPRFDRSLILLQSGGGARPAGRIAMIPVEPGPDAKPVTIALKSARTIAGRVTYADSGKSVPQARVDVFGVPYQADGEGRFRIVAPPTDRFTVQAQSPDGAPYLIAEKDVRWPKEAVEQSVDLALIRGVVVGGKVVEEGTGRPVAGAVVYLVPYTTPDGTSDVSLPAVTAPDGTYRVAAPPGPGSVVVQGPDDDYVLREFGAYGVPLEARPGHERFYAHAYRAVELKPGKTGQHVDLTLRRGAAIHGRVVGPDDRPIRNASVFSRAGLASPPNGGWKLWRIHSGFSFLNLTRDGHFALHGLDADAEVPAYFLEPGRKLGATARFSGKPAANESVTVRLEPCGTARARLVGPDGKPLDRYPAGELVSLVITPGPPYASNPAKDGPLFADESGVARLDPMNYGPDFRSDAQGRVTWPVLIPGASYRIVDTTPTFGGGEPVIRREFVVGAGEVVELGDIVIARPQRRFGQ